WAFCLDQGPRSVGWSIEVKNVPDRLRSLTRTEFVMKSILCAIKLYLIVDAGLWYTHLSHVEYGPTATSFAALPFHQRCLTVYFFGAAGYATIYVQYTLLSIVCVMSGFSEPKRWPDLFGKWRDAYTIRRIWGYVFHSPILITHLQFTSRLSSAAATALRLPRGTRISSNVQLLVGFGLSTSLHFLGDITTGTDLTHPSALFFFVQPFAIMFEDFVIKKINGGRDIKKPSRLTGAALIAVRTLGCCWVFGWFVWTLPLFADPQTRVGLGEDRMIKREWSVIEWVVAAMGRQERD
ncbi:hypothetical protein BDV98DRAFT_627845, partial [Pterulicium gracile]